MPAYCDLTAEAETKEQEKKNKDLINERIKEYVFENLGQPKNLYRLDIRSLWENFYRINMWSVDSSSIIETYVLSDSFFIEISEGGEVIACNPEIKRRYNGENL